MSCRKLPWLLLLAALLAAGWVGRGWWEARRDRAWEGPVTLWSEDQPPRPVFLPRRASAEERAAAALLAEALGAMSGRPVEVRTEPWWTGRAGLYVGETRLARGRPIPAEGTAAEAGAILPPEWVEWRTVGRAVVLRAGELPAAAAAARFLEEVAGAAWVLPGPLGNHLPARRELVVPAGVRVEAPGYVSREIGGSGPGWAEWAARHGVRGRIEFSHHLGEVFPLEVLREHPEWQPVLGGQPYLPRGPGDYRWQPDLLQPGVSERAAAAAAAAFAADPARLTYSLGLNDSDRFGARAMEWWQAAGRPWFRGRPDYSGLVFDFSNRVARRVEESHPDRLLGCLAYWWWENTPPFAVAPNLVPFLTADRTQAYDPGFAAEDRALRRRWAGAGPRLFGLYDYWYGYPFAVPRVPLRAIAQTVREAHQDGARAWYAEAQPVWGFDGPKLWLAAHLLWDPAADADALLERYWSAAYGAAAAPMRDFFADAEAVWMRQPPPARWLKYYGDAHQARLFTAADRDRLDGHLRRAAELAGPADASASGPARRRVALTTQAFAATARFGEHQAALEAVSAWPSAEEVLTATGERDLAALLAARPRLREIERELSAPGPLSDLNRALVAKPFYFQSDPLPRWLTLARLADSPAFPALRASLPPGEESLARLAETLAASPARPLALANGGWERTAPGTALEPSGPPPQGWEMDLREARFRQVHLTRAAARTGRTGLRAEGCDALRLARWIPVEPGRAYAFRLWVRGSAAPASQAYLRLLFCDATGRRLPSPPWDRLPPGGWPDWRPLLAAGHAPDGAALAHLSLTVQYQEPGDWLEADDGEAWQWP